MKHRRITKGNIKFLITLCFSLSCFFFFTLIAGNSNISNRNVASMILEMCGNFVCAIFMGSCLLNRKDQRSAAKLFVDYLFFVSIVFTSDFYTWYLEGTSVNNLDWLSYFLNALYFFADIEMIFAFTKYIRTFVKNDPNWMQLYLKTISTFRYILIAILIINYFKPFMFTIYNGHYHRLFCSYLIFAVAVALVIVYSLLMIKEDMDKQEKISMFAYILLPLAGTVAQMIITGYSFVAFAIFICTLIIYAHGHIRQQQVINKDKIKLQEQNTALMLSQIQPHFLFNTLNTVVALCDIDPKLAKKATIDFSDFLEHNLKSVYQKTPIPFDEELKHVKAYLDIEQIRFGKSLNVIYDIKQSNFSIPSLTVQPLVENAVKHGVMKKLEGGTVTISTEENSKSFIVKISDDGVGFNTEEATIAGHGIGINNIRNRIETQCGGTLTIQSSQGKGTVALITVPKENKL